MAFVSKTAEVVAAVGVPRFIAVPHQNFVQS